jgi:hypothetical protein
VEQHPEHCSDASVKNPAITVHVTRQQLTGRDGVDPVGATDRNANMIQP